MGAFFRPLTAAERGKAKTLPARKSAFYVLKSVFKIRGWDGSPQRNSFLVQRTADGHGGIRLRRWRAHITFTTRSPKSAGFLAGQIEFSRRLTVAIHGDGNRS